MGYMWFSMNLISLFLNSRTLLLGTDLPPPLKIPWFSFSLPDSFKYSCAICSYHLQILLLALFTCFNALIESTRNLYIKYDKEDFDQIFTWLLLLFHYKFIIYYLLWNLSSFKKIKDCERGWMGITMIIRKCYLILSRFFIIMWSLYLFICHTWGCL